MTTNNIRKNSECDAGVAQLVEHQLSKLRVAGSIPVSRSSEMIYKFGDKLFFLDNINAKSACRCSSVVEHFLGKEEVTGSIPVMGSR